MSKTKKIISIICVVVTLILILSYYLFPISIYDNFFYDLIIKLKNPTITEIFKLFTIAGGVIGTIILMVIIICFNRKKGLYFALNIVVICLLNLILKNIFMRDRPIDINIIDETGYSFPSGHTMTAVAAYGLLLYYLYRSKLKKYIRNICMILVTIMLILIPISRVYLGVHFFSDITLGTSISILWLMLYTEYLNRKNI